MTVTLTVQQRDRGAVRGEHKMALLKNRSMAGALGTAALVAFAVTAYVNQASSHTSETAKPAQTLFEQAAVGGRTGCEVQSWPYIAPECLIGEHAKAKPARRI
jgi:hypothetical protein